MANWNIISTVEGASGTATELLLPEIPQPVTSPPTFPPVSNAKQFALYADSTTHLAYWSQNGSPWAVAFGSGSGGPPFLDNVILMENHTDATKKLQLTLAGLTTATTRTWTVQDHNITVAGIDFAQTWTADQTFENILCNPVVTSPPSVFNVGSISRGFDNGYFGALYSINAIGFGGFAPAHMFMGWDGVSGTLQITAPIIGSIISFGAGGGINAFWDVVPNLSSTRNLGQGGGTPIYWLGTYSDAVYLQALGSAPSGLTTGGGGIYYSGSAYYLWQNGSPGAWMPITSAGAPFVDNVPLLYNVSDNTKQLEFQLSAITTGHTLTWTVQNHNIMVAGIDFAQTWTADQTFENVLCNSGAGPFNVGSTGRGFDAGYFGALFVVNAIEFGSSNMAIDYSSGLAALVVTAPIIGSVISFSVGGGTTSYWDITPSTTAARNLGGPTLFWLSAYTEALYLNGLSSAPINPPSGAGGFYYVAGSAYEYWNGTAWVGFVPGGNNIPFVDSPALLFNAADNTKQLQITLGSLTTSTTRVWTAQDTNLTVAGINVAQTWTADQTFHNVLCNSGTGPYNIGSTSRGFDNGYFGELFVVNAIEFGASNMAVSYSSGLSALVVTAPITGSVISFSVGGGVTSYWDITPSASGTRNLGSGSGPLYWLGVYTDTLYINNQSSAPSSPPGSAGGIYYAGGSTYKIWTGSWSTVNFTGSPFIDSVSILYNAADNTKQLEIYLGNIGHASTIQWTAQNIALTVAGIDVAQTWTADQTFENVLCNSGAGPFNVGSTGRGFDAGYFGALFVVNAIEFGSSNMAIDYSSGLAALVVTAPIIGSVISFSVGGGTTSYWDITPSTTAARNLGGPTLFWLSAYTEALYLNGLSSAPINPPSGAGGFYYVAGSAYEYWNGTAWVGFVPGGNNIPFVDSPALLFNAADNTKQLQITLGSLTTSTTRVWTAQDTNLTVAGINVAQTWTADQTFHNVLCNSGTGPYNIGSTSRGFDNGYFGELFVVNAIEFGASNMAVSYSSGLSALVVTAPITGSVISFSVGGGVTSYWDITPSASGTRNLGSGSGPLYWLGVYTDTLYINNQSSAPSSPPGSAGGIYYAGGSTYKIWTGSWSTVNFTGSPFIDSVSILYNAADNTKQLEIYLGNIGHASTIQWTAQNIALTVAGIDVAQTWTADQTFHNVLCNSGSGPFNIGSTSRGFDNGYFGELFVINAIEFGSSNMAVNYSSGLAALVVTAPIIGSIFSFSVGGLNTSYWDLVPSSTNARKLGGPTLFWLSTYTEALYLNGLSSAPTNPPSGAGGFYYVAGSGYEYWNGSAWVGFIPGAGSVPFVDSPAILFNAADNTKKLQISLSGLSSSTTRVWTVQNQNITVAGIDYTQTWTADQTFQSNILCSGATGPFNIGSNTRGFDAIYVGDVHASNDVYVAVAVEFGVSNIAMGWNSGLGALIITAPVTGSIFSFSSAGAVTSYWDIAPIASATNNRNLGSSTQFWKGTYINTLYLNGQGSMPTNPPSSCGGFYYVAGNVYEYWTGSAWLAFVPGVGSASGSPDWVQYAGSGGLAADANFIWHHAVQQLAIIGTSNAAVSVTSGYIFADQGFNTTSTNLTTAVNVQTGGMTVYAAQVIGNSSTSAIGGHAPYGDNILRIFDYNNAPGISLYNNSSTRISQWRAGGSSNYAFEVMNDASTPVSIFEITQTGGVNMNTTGGSGLTINMGSFGDAITCNPAQGGSIAGFYSFIVTIGEMNSLWLPEYTGGLGTIPATGSSQMGGLAYLGTTNYAYWNGSAWASFNFASSGGGVPSITGTANQVLVNGTSGSPVTSAATLTLAPLVQAGAFQATDTIGPVFYNSGSTFSVSYNGFVLAAGVSSVFTGTATGTNMSFLNTTYISGTVPNFYVQGNGFVFAQNYYAWISSGGYIGGASANTLTTYSAITSISIMSGLIIGLSGTSDARLKDIIEPYVYGIDAIRKLRPYRYRFNALFQSVYHRDDLDHIGLLAQDVESAMPTAWFRDAKGYGGIDWNGVTCSLIVAAQQTDVRIQQTDTRIAALESELAELKRRLN